MYSSAETDMQLCVWKLKFLRFHGVLCIQGLCRRVCLLTTYLDVRIRVHVLEAWKHWANAKCYVNAIYGKMSYICTVIGFVFKQQMLLSSCYMLRKRAPFEMSGMTFFSVTALPDLLSPDLGEWRWGGKFKAQTSSLTVNRNTSLLDSSLRNLFNFVF